MQKSTLIFIILFAIAVSGCTSEISYNAPAAEVKDKSACKIDKDCQTPGSYLIRSNCPYTSKCIDSRCEVVCPLYNYSESPDNSGGYQTYPVTCKKDTDCDCTGYTSKDMDRCACLESGCFAVIK